jgi:excisionase family DNA binding protein
MTAALTAARSIDPEGVEDYEAALSTNSVKLKEKKEPSLLLKQSEVARLYGCSRWTVRNLVRDGKLSPLNIRGVYRYRRSEVLAIVGGVS